MIMDDLTYFLTRQPAYFESSIHAGHQKIIATSLGNHGEMPCSQNHDQRVAHIAGMVIVSIIDLSMLDMGQS